MKNKKIVLALGGNALGGSSHEQIEIIKSTAKPIVDLVEQGNSVVIAHGNGPQVGMINNCMHTAALQGLIKGEMPLPECGAMSQGYIGYHLQNGIANELAARGINKKVATIITQILVDENDPAFLNPTKPIGAFYTEQEAKKIAAEKKCIMIEDAGRGYRRVIASPKPIDVIEKKVIYDMEKTGHIVIAAGGGGIPVIMKNGRLVGIPAVIDKDLASEKLAELMDADMLVILTAVNRVAINFGKPNQQEIIRMNLKEAKDFCEAGHFGVGSMLPKVQAAMKFVESGKNKRAIIGSLEKAIDALKGVSGTIFYAS